MHHTGEILTPDGGSEWLRWLGAESVEAKCLACHTQTAMPSRVSVKNPFATDRITYVQCPECDSLVGLDFKAPDYREEGDAPAALKFAKEQGAGIAAMIAPLYWVDREGVSSFLDVGSGYGFALHAAEKLFGWRVHGADPSYFARVGAKELGLTIEDRYVSVDSPAEGGPYDIVLGSEVIEHVPDPVEFARILRESAGEHGRVILTTPNAIHALDRKDASRALMALAPGSHFAVFSADGLERILKEAGFTFVSIVERESGLVAAAGAAHFEFDPTRDMPAQDFIDYLQKAVRDVEPDSDLHCGLLVRLIRAQAHGADWDGVEGGLDQLAGLMSRRYGIDLFDPDRFETVYTERFRAFSASNSFCLGPAFFCLGLLRLVAYQDRAGAEKAFRASRKASKLARDALLAIGADDIDLQHHEVRAALHEAQTMAWRDVASAATLLRRIWPGEGAPGGEALETLMQIVEVGNEVRSKDVDWALETARDHLLPIALGMAEPGHSADITGLIAMARRMAFLGEPIQGLVFARAGLMWAETEDSVGRARHLKAQLDQQLDAKICQRDTELLITAMAGNQPDEVSGPALRLLEHAQSLSAATRIALSLWCLGSGERLEAVVRMFPDVDRLVGTDRDSAISLLAIANVRLAQPGYVDGRIQSLSATGQWDRLGQFLDAVAPLDLETLDPATAYGLGMYAHVAARDFDLAERAFIQALKAADPGIIASARVHRIEALLAQGKLESASAELAEAHEALKSDHQGVLAPFADQLKALSRSLSDQVQA